MATESGIMRVLNTSKVWETIFKIAAQRDGFDRDLSNQIDEEAKAFADELENITNSYTTNQHSIEQHKQKQQRPSPIIDATSSTGVTNAQSKGVIGNQQKHHSVTIPNNHDRDVFLGKNIQGIKLHPGNKALRDFVNPRKRGYADIKQRKDKFPFARSLSLGFVATQGSPPVKFFDNDGVGGWVEATGKVSIEEISRMLRDKSTNHMGAQHQDLGEVGEEQNQQQLGIPSSIDQNDDAGDSSNNSNGAAANENEDHSQNGSNKAKSNRIAVNENNNDSGEGQSSSESPNKEYLPYVVATTVAASNDRLTKKRTSAAHQSPDGATKASKKSKITKESASTSSSITGENDNNNINNNNNTATIASRQSPTVKYLGDEGNGMALILPADGDSDTREIIYILKQIEGMMRKRLVKNQLENWCNNQDKDDSARHTNSGRMEIFLEAEGKSSQAFDTIVGRHLPAGAKGQLLDYARHQAQKDPRIQGRKSRQNKSRRGQEKEDFKFGNFSLIVSYGEVLPQHPHIDLINPNYQFGLVLPTDADSTEFLDSDDQHHIDSVGSLVIHWREIMRNTDQTMSLKLIKIMEDDKKVKGLLEEYGDALLSPKYLRENMKKKKLPTGSLLSLPGSIVHAGAASDSFRAVIFFSGWPRDARVKEYNPDTQYTGVTLMGDIIGELWDKESLREADKLFLLELMAQYVVQRGIKNKAQFESSYLAEGEIQGFVGKLEKLNLNKGNTRRKTETKAELIKGILEKW